VHVGQRCAFCIRLDAIYRQDLPVDQQNAAIDALFDLADRARRARRVSGRRRKRRNY
jgi:hypothetical protein